MNKILPIILVVVLSGCSNTSEWIADYRCIETKYIKKVGYEKYEEIKGGERATYIFSIWDYGRWDDRYVWVGGYRHLVLEDNDDYIKIRRGTKNSYIKFDKKNKTLYEFIADYGTAVEKIGEVFFECKEITQEEGREGN